jgi:gliding motility-associated-like protein
MGGTAQVSVLASGGNNVYTYAWNPNIGNGAGPYTVNPSATTVYTVTVTDGCGQTWSAQITITVNPSPLAAFSCTTLPLAVGQTITFTDSSTGATIWNWNFGDGNSSTLQNPSHSYSQWGQYTVTLIVSNSFGCYDTTTCDIRMEEEIFVPNVFTPNSDGNNDLFVVQNTGMAEYSIIIYDRWGIKMFETTAPNQHWDGKGQNGTDAPDGTYYYVVKARTYTDKEYIFKGFLTLFR